MFSCVHLVKNLAGNILNINKKNILHYCQKIEVSKIDQKLQ